MLSHRTVVALSCLLASLLSGPARSAPDRTLAYQGVLEHDGSPAPDGALPMTFRFYTTATGGTALQAVTMPSVELRAAAWSWPRSTSQSSAAR